MTSLKYLFLGFCRRSLSVCFACLTLRRRVYRLSVLSTWNVTLRWLSPTRICLGWRSTFSTSVVRWQIWSLRWAQWCSRWRRWRKVSASWRSVWTMMWLPRSRRGLRVLLFRASLPARLPSIWLLRQPSICQPRRQFLVPSAPTSLLFRRHPAHPMPPLWRARLIDSQ